MTKAKRSVMCYLESGLSVPLPEGVEPNTPAAFVLIVAAFQELLNEPEQIFEFHQELNERIDVGTDAENEQTSEAKQQDNRE